MPTVLCIDDNHQSLHIRKLLLEMQRYTVLTADSGHAGLSLLAENLVDVVVLDYRMPGMDGLPVATAIRERPDRIPILILTGYPKELPKELREMVNAVVIKGQLPGVLPGELRRLTGGAKKPPATDIAARTAAYLKKTESRKINCIAKEVSG